MKTMKLVKHNPRFISKEILGPFQDEEMKLIQARTFVITTLGHCTI